MTESAVEERYRAARAGPNRAARHQRRVKACIATTCALAARVRPDLDASSQVPRPTLRWSSRTDWLLKPRIDAEWRDFWGRGATLRAAMTRDPLPNKKSQARKAIERSRELVDALNLARAEARVGPLGYYLDTTPDFLAVRRYEKALAKADKEQAKRDKQAKSGRKVEPVVFPRVPAAVGTTAFCRARNARGDRPLPRRLGDKLTAPGDPARRLRTAATPFRCRQADHGPLRSARRWVRASVGVDALDARSTALQAAASRPTPSVARR